MPPSSAFSQAGLSISYGLPLLNGAGAFIDTLTDAVQNYTHVNAARGGYYSCDFDIHGGTDLVEDWYSDGLGRNIVVYDESQNPIWNGFVNKITAHVGALTSTRGPLMNITNKAAIIYSAADTSTSPPTLGTRVLSAYQQDTVSQALYGVLEKVLSTGGVTAGNAASIVANYLALQSTPDTLETLDFSGNVAQPSVTINCLGYYNWLSMYTYSATGTGTSNTDVALKAVLAASPNAIFSSDLSLINPNTLQVPIYDSSQRSALAIIKALASLGDAANARWDYSVDAQRRLAYAAAPTTISYLHHIYDNNQRIEDTSGVTVPPYRVNAGQWAFISDFLIGHIVPGAGLDSDPRALYIETATFRAPSLLTLVGSRYATLPQKLAQLGLSGIG